MLKVMIVDDEKAARKRLSRFLEDQSQLQVTAECVNGEEAVEAMRHHVPDIVFLDIQMPGMNGFDVVSAIKSGEKTPAFVFVTAYDEFAVRAFEVAAVDYVLKPYNKERILKALARAQSTLDQNSAITVARRLTETLEKMTSRSNKLTLKSDNHIVVLDHADIDWIEATGHHVKVHAGAKSYLSRIGLTELCSQLPEPLFQRIHRSYIVNVNKVREIHPLFHGDCMLVLSNQAKVYMSRSYSEKIKLLLGTK